MKLLLMCAALSATMYGQAAKAAPSTEAPQVSTERPLTEAESLKLQLTQAKIQLLQKKYDIEGYQKELAPISAEQMTVAKAACASVGVAEAKMQTECGLATGFDQDGKTMVGQDGKPVAPRVWKIPPTTLNPAPPAEKEKAK